MKLEQYFKRCEWQQVRDVLVKSYNIDQSRILRTFKSAFYMLQKETAIPNDWFIGMFGTCGAECDVQKPENSDLNYLPSEQFFAFELGMQIVVISDSKLSPAEIVANFLWSYDKSIVEKFA
jgi:hypothetical protein